MIEGEEEGAGKQAAREGEGEGEGGRGKVRGLMEPGLRPLGAGSIRLRRCLLGGCTARCKAGFRWREGERRGEREGRGRGEREGRGERGERREERGE